MNRLHVKQIDAALLGREITTPTIMIGNVPMRFTGIGSAVEILDRVVSIRDSYLAAFESIDEVVEMLRAHGGRVTGPRSSGAQTP